jgi:hypothetical protein
MLSIPNKTQMSDYLEPLDRWAATLNAFNFLEVTSQALYNSWKLAKCKLNLATIVLIEPCNCDDESYEEMLREVHCEPILFSRESNIPVPGPRSARI